MWDLTCVRTVMFLHVWDQCMCLFDTYLAHNTYITNQLSKLNGSLLFTMECEKHSVRSCVSLMLIQKEYVCAYLTPTWHPNTYSLQDLKLAVMLVRFRGHCLCELIFFFFFFDRVHTLDSFTLELDRASRKMWIEVIANFKLYTLYCMSLYVCSL